MASDLRGSPNRSQSLSQTLGKKYIQTNLTLLDDLSIPMCHEKKKKQFVTKPPKGWSQTLLTESCNNLQRTQLCTLDHEPSKPAARWILLGEFQVFDFLFFFQVENSLSNSLHYTTLSCNKFFGYDGLYILYKHIYTQYINSYVLQYVSNLFWGSKHLSPKLRYLLQVRLIQVAKLGPCRDSKFPLDPSSLS